jgi:hypothetical protein
MHLSNPKNKYMGKNIILVLLLFTSTLMTWGQETVHYTGTTLSNPDYHHGQLAPAIGVHNIQVFRANREHPELADGYGWTYNHAPMLAYWNNQFYLEYLSNPIGEHEGAGQTLIVTSKDGYAWSNPVIAFPPFKIPDGTTKEGHSTVAKDLYAVMHQRIGFYVSKENRLFALGYYGIVIEPGDDPNDGKGIGRVIREIKADGSFGPTYFIRHNSSWKQQNDPYSFYTKSKDKGLVKACNEILANPLMMQQWVEEADRNDPLIPIHKEYKAFSYYHLPNGKVVGLWKYALTGISADEGKTWSEVARAPRFVNANAKIWGQRTSDGNYATVYNPSVFRWPLGLSVSKDGLDYTNLLLVQGEISTMRYGGKYKSYGPQYVRGILEGNGTPPDGNMWVTYSMNKEDIWVAKIPVPVTDKAPKHADDVFDNMPQGSELNVWNIYSPLWAPVKIEKNKEGKRCLLLKDFDNFDFAKAERVIPATKKLTVEFTITANQNNKGVFHIELQDSKGLGAFRMIFDSTATCLVKSGYRYSKAMSYNADQAYHIKITCDADSRFYKVFVDGKQVKQEFFYSPVESISRVVFRTGEIRRHPDIESPADQSFDVPNAGEKDTTSSYWISSLKTYEE